MYVYLGPDPQNDNFQKNFFSPYAPYPYASKKPSMTIRWSFFTKIWVKTWFRAQKCPNAQIWLFGPRPPKNDNFQKYFFHQMRLTHTLPKSPQWLSLDHFFYQDMAKKVFLGPNAQIWKFAPDPRIFRNFWKLSNCWNRLTNMLPTSYEWSFYLVYNKSYTILSIFEITKIGLLSKPLKKQHTWPCVE